MTKQPRLITHAGLDKMRARLLEQKARVQTQAMQYGHTVRDSSGEFMDSGVCTAGAEMDIRIAGAQARATLEDLTNVRLQEYPLPAKVNGTVSYGTRVTYTLNGKQDSIKLVCFADMFDTEDEDRTTIESPLGKVLIDRSVGDQYETSLNGRPVRVTIEGVYPLTSQDLA
jgi:transcription elongation GreA/GreB family factor